MGPTTNTIKQESAILIPPKCATYWAVVVEFPAPRCPTSSGILGFQYLENEDFMSQLYPGNGLMMIKSTFHKKKKKDGSKDEDFRPISSLTFKQVYKPASPIRKKNVHDSKFLGNTHVP